MRASCRGTGSLTKQNTGTVILSGANTYSGGTTVSGGTLQGTTTSLQGNIANNAGVVFDQTTTGTYSSVMSGTGSLTKQNTGHGYSQRRQHLFRRTYGDWRYIAGQYDQPAGQHREHRDRHIRSVDQREHTPVRFQVPVRSRN